MACHFKEILTERNPKRLLPINSAPGALCWSSEEIIISWWNYGPKIMKSESFPKSAKHTGDAI